MPWHHDNAWRRDGVMPSQRCHDNAVMAADVIAVPCPVTPWRDSTQMVSVTMCDCASIFWQFLPKQVDF